MSTVRFNRLSIVIAMSMSMACHHTQTSPVAPMANGPAPKQDQGYRLADNRPAATHSDDEQAAKNRRAALLATVTAAIHFDFDKSDVRADDQSLLDRKAAVLLANPAVHIKVEGNGDERGSDEYNLVLGNKRAVAAKQYLTAKGIDASRIEAVSFGEERPVDPGHTESAWAANRRDDFEVTSGTLTSPPAGIQ